MKESDQHIEIYNQVSPGELPSAKMQIHCSLLCGYLTSEFHGLGNWLPQTGA